jgi:glycosyltransferase involved in cell wall biosynthesis
MGAAAVPPSSPGSNMEPILISVIVAVRNGASTLQRCLDSLREQTHRRWEVVVMDGGSDDGTQAILISNADRIAYWESEGDRGVAHAWNKALDHVQGEWVLFLGSDDRLHSATTFADVAPLLRACPADVDVAYGTLDIVNADGTVRVRLGKPWVEARERLELGMAIPHPATFHRRRLFDRLGRYDERYRISSDYELLLRHLLSAEARFLDIVVTDMGAGGLSDRPSSRLQAARETHRIRVRHGLTRTPEWRSVPVLKAALLAMSGRFLGERWTERVRRAYSGVRGVLRNR